MLNVRFILYFFCLVNPIFNLGQCGLDCDCMIPPVSVNSSLGILNVSDISHYGVSTTSSNNPLCYNTTNFPLPLESVHLGGVNTLVSCDSFMYSVVFDKPILNLEFVLLTGGGLTYENFIFSSNSGFLIQPILLCDSFVNGDTVFLGNLLTLTGMGSGQFKIIFDKPACEFSIKGDGCWGGSGFVICTNSIQTPDLWASMELVEQACSEDSIQFTAYGSVGPYIFEYSVNGGAVQQLVSNEPSVTISAPPSPGTYVYELLTITDGNGNLMNITCNNSLTVQVPEPLLAQFTASPTSGFAPLSIILQNQSSNATNYSWFVNEIGGFDTTQPPASTAENPMFTLNDTGVYEITLVAFNDLGCSDTTVQTVHVLEQLQVVIPNVFTPNNDGVNDWFGITSNVEANASIVILNRWGNVVFEKEFVTTPNVFESLWDGTSTSSVTTPSSVAEGVYFYRVKVGEEDPKAIEFSGFVHLKK